MHKFGKIKMQVNNLGKTLTLNPQILDKNKDTIIITTFENKGVGRLQTFKFCQNKKVNHPFQSQTLHILQMVNN